ncbi:MAG: hypothetical protein ACRD0U_11200 [Acidimicrobiales bacterium]
MTPLAPGTATSIGSLPHTDPTAAARLVLDRHAALPAAPSLPRRSLLEGMLAQAAWGLPGVRVLPDGELAVERSLLDPDAPPDDSALTGEPWVGLQTFLEAAKGERRRMPIKLQLTGPLTLGIALWRAGAAGPRAFAAAATAVRHRVRHLVDLAAQCVPGAPLVVFFDEPWFGLVGDPDLPIGARAATDLLSEALRAAGPGVTTGVHCCAEADWAAILHAKPHVLSLPVDHAGRLRPGDVRPHLEGGGYVAWGAVPTSGPVGDGTTGLWHRLADRWHDLVAGGCDPVLVRTRALVTPACGLAGHNPEAAVRVLDLATALGNRIAEGAVTTYR